jgi:hypothetical protein
LAISGLGFQANTRVTIGNVIAPPLTVSANQILVTAAPMADGVQDIGLTDPPTLANSVLSGVLTYGAGPNDTLALIPFPNPQTPVGGEAPNPVQVRVLAPDGVTPVQGASVVFSSNPTANFSACPGASCTVLSDETGQASTFVTPLTAGATTITAQLAPGSYSSPQQVQTTLVGRELALDLALVPQNVSVAQGATVNVNLSARVLSNGAGLSGQTVNFCQLTPGQGCLPGSWSVTTTTNVNGYAQATLPIASMTSEIDGSVCVGANSNPCQSFHVFAVAPSVLQIQAVAGTPQVVNAGQVFQPVVVRVTDSSVPANPVLGATVTFQFTGERAGGDSTVISVGDTIIGTNPSPVILFNGQSAALSGATGLASWQPTTEGFDGDMAILGTAIVGTAQAQFALQTLPPL